MENISCSYTYFMLRTLRPVRSLLAPYEKARSSNQNISRHRKWGISRNKMVKNASNRGEIISCSALAELRCATGCLETVLY